MITFPAARPIKNAFSSAITRHRGTLTAFLRNEIRARRRGRKGKIKRCVSGRSFFFTNTPSAVTQLDSIKPAKKEKKNLFQTQSCIIQFYSNSCLFASLRTQKNRHRKKLKKKRHRALKLDQNRQRKPEEYNNGRWCCFSLSLSLFYFAD